ncbi:mechanosensitive ion channel [Candidatus Woesearchaeota archaeon]|nr:mechanosensitive ion channel [Candidatus Woesearchaeota archaeon]
MVNLEFLIKLINENSIRIIIAISILLLGVVIGRFLSKLVYKVLVYIGLSKLLKTSIKSKLPVEEIISYIIKYVIYFSSLVIALNQIGVNEFAQQLILVLILIMIGSIIFFALRDFVPNFIAGIIIHRKNIIKVNENIKILGIEGTVSEYDILHIKVINQDKEIFIIPNSLIMKNIISKKKRA